MKEKDFADILNVICLLLSITVPLIEPKRNSRGKMGHIPPAAECEASTAEGVHRAAGGVRL